MKHGFISSMTALLATAALVGCSSADESPEPTVVDRDQTRYLSVAISNPAASRAFENGIEDENRIESIHIGFYDGTGAPLYLHSADLTKEGSESTNDDGNNVTKIWSSVIPVHLTAGQQLPAYAMAFVNANNMANVNTYSITDIVNTRRSQVTNTQGGVLSFPMANSVYYGDDPITGAKGVRMMATPIAELQLFDTEDKARSALETGSGIIDIYVERLAAKIGVNLNPDDIKPFEEVNGYKLEFVPEFWHPNAIDSEEFVIKAFATGGATDARKDIDPTIVPSKVEMDNALLASFPGWNDAEHYRCYWACSPAYFESDYPKVSDDITDGHNYPLEYYSYNVIAQGRKDDSKQISVDQGVAWTPGVGFKASGKDGYFYSREATVSLEALKNMEKNPKAAAASVVIVGRYRLTKNATDTDPAAELDPKTTFYLYGRENQKWNLYATEADLKKRMIMNQRIVFTAKSAEQLLESENMFEIKHPDLGVRKKEEAVAGRFVALQLNAAAVEGNFYFHDGNKMTRINTENLDEVNRRLWQGGAAQMYNEGLAFFSVPIRHLAFNDKTMLKEGQIDWLSLTRGSLGVVRNHVYTIDVTCITGLATGLRDPDQPIVPPMDEVSYSVAARLNVLSWNVVPTQNVEL